MIKKLISLAVTALVLLTAAAPASAGRPAVPDNPRAGYAAPSGCDAHDYQKLVAFLEQEDADGVKNGDKISENYTPTDPSTWGDGIFSWDASGRIREVRTNFRQEPLYGDLDLSGCTGLEYLGCTYCELRRLDVSGCTELGLIYCYASKLSEIDVSGCSGLTYFNCSNNAVAELDVSDCKMLETLACGNNGLKKLDVSGLSRLSKLYCLNNPLTEIIMTGTRLPVESVTAGAGGKVGVNQGVEQDTNAVHAYPDEGWYFDGWYDTAGNKLSDETLLDFCFINDAHVTALFATAADAKPFVTLSSVASSGKPKVSWAPVVGAEKYEVWRSAGKTGGYKKVFTTTNLSYTNTGAKPGEVWYYKVRAVNGDGSFGKFSSPKWRTCDLPRPVVTVKLSNNKPKLSWDAVEGAVGYEVWRRAGTSGDYTKIKTTANTTFTNPSANAGTKYYYKVVAVHSNVNANSAPSAVKSITSK